MRGEDPAQLRHLLALRCADPGREKFGESTSKEERCNCDHERKDAEDQEDRAHDATGAKLITLAAQSNHERHENTREWPCCDQLVNDVGDLKGGEIRVKSPIRTKRGDEDDQPHPAEQA